MGLAAKIGLYENLQLSKTQDVFASLSRLCSILFYNSTELHALVLDVSCAPMITSQPWGK